MKNTALFVASLLFSLFLAELALRALDVLPYHQRHGLTRGEPQVLDRDADLGWVLRPGRFVWKAPAPGTPDLDIRAPAADYEKWRLAFDPYDHLGEAAQDYWADKIIASGILKTR